MPGHFLYSDRASLILWNGKGVITINSRKRSDFSCFAHSASSLESLSFLGNGPLEKRPHPSDTDRCDLNLAILVKDNSAKEQMETPRLEEARNRAKTEAIRAM